MWSSSILVQYKAPKKNQKQQKTQFLFGGHDKSIRIDNLSDFQNCQIIKITYKTLYKCILLTGV